MCGIAGMAGGMDTRLASSRVARMTDVLDRRGPDDVGLDSWAHCVLGHRRLSIFDLSAAGHQPMRSQDGSVGVVFNGAVYNFRELRRELEAVGFTFSSETDTEVLVHGYRAWGIDSLVDRLSGMFAFGLWDDAAQTLFLVRDRLGVKPLVYSDEGGVMAFASTTHALDRGGFAGDVDPAAVGEFLEYGYVTEGRAIFHRLKKLPPATILRWRNGSSTSTRYWSPPLPEHRAGPGFEEAVHRVEEIFLEAVRRRLHADVPVGALLSGGIDSTLVCWAISSFGADITAFTVGTPGDPEDETAGARATARRLGLRHEIIDVTPADDSILDELIESYSEPFACASALGMLQVSRAVRGSARVLLTGDGGDDLFLGYPRHRHLWLAEGLARRLPSVAARGWRRVRPRLPAHGPLKRAANFIDYATGGMGPFLNASDGLPFYRRNEILGERLREVFLPTESLPPSIASARNVLAEYLEHDRRNQFVSEYLVKVDGATMHHAIEARSPFLDRDLWDYAARLPVALHLRRGSLKAILRELVRRRIGAEPAGRAKRGFSVPVQRWVATRWYSMALEEVTRGRLASDGWIDSDAAARAFGAARDAGYAPRQLWYLLVLERWMKNRGLELREGGVHRHLTVSAQVSGGPDHVG